MNLSRVAKRTARGALQGSNQRPRPAALCATLTELVCLVCALSFSLAGQTTQGLISGRLVSTVTGQGVPSAIVEYSSSSSTKGGTAPADANGYYTLPLLSPG